MQHDRVAVRPERLGCCRASAVLDLPMLLRWPRPSVVGYSRVWFAMGLEDTKPKRASTQMDTRSFWLSKNTRPGRFKIRARACNLEHVTKKRVRVRFSGLGFRIQHAWVP